MENKTILQTMQKIVLISYKTPVAFLDKQSKTLFQTTSKYSKTTSKHQNNFTGSMIESGAAQQVVNISQTELIEKLNNLELV
jgi:hypothetical protein